MRFDVKILMRFALATCTSKVLGHFTKEKGTFGTEPRADTGFLVLAPLPDPRRFGTDDLPGQVGDHYSAVVRATTKAELSLESSSSAASRGAFCLPVKRNLRGENC